ncbi:MAG TPA: high-potential iron-sulfur protein [Rhizomicrobium sp.]|nr:high-potential iron-sulfur protein [Rhizomicrobium sp.]
MIDKAKIATGVSRRQLLRNATASACGAAALVAVATQSAQAGPVSKADAGYQPTPKGDQKCDNCTLFQAPSSCKFVSGDVSPSGWCKLYAKKS